MNDILFRHLVIAATIFFSTNSHAAPAYRTLVYHHGTVGLELNLTPHELTVVDRAGIRILRRSSCNAKVVKDYWSDLGKHVARLKPTSQSRQLAAAPSFKRSGASLKADNQIHQITMFDPKLRYFDRMAKTTNEIFIAERRACRGRK